MILYCSYDTTPRGNNFQIPRGNNFLWMDSLKVYNNFHGATVVNIHNL